MSEKKPAAGAAARPVRSPKQPRRKRPNTHEGVHGSGEVTMSGVAEVKSRADRYRYRLGFVSSVLRNDAAVADVLGVDRAQITRWRGATQPSRENAERLAGLDLTIELLSDYLDPETIRDWLEGFNAHLGGRRPVDLLRQGRLSDVIGAVEALKSGAYA